MTKLVNLNDIDLSTNLIKDKALNIYDLTNLTSINLEYINFSKNKLNIVPIQLMYLTKLKFTDLSNNDFKSTFIPNNMKHINIDISKKLIY